MRSKRIIIRAFTKEGYHRDILIMNDEQVTMNDTRVTEPILSLNSRLIGHGGSINPTDFPEVAHFEVVVEMP